MKTKKWLVVAVLAVLVLGGVYGGLRYAENRVLAAVRDALSGADNASAGSVRFTLPGRKLIVTDLVATLYAGTPFAGTVTIKSVEAVLPWTLVLSGEGEGSSLVAETLDIQGFEHVSQGAEAERITVDKERALGVRTDLALLRRIVMEKKADPAEVTALEECTSLERSEAEGVTLALPRTGGEARLDAFVMERKNGLRIGSARATGLAVSLAGESGAAPEKVSEKMLEIASLAVENLDMPTEAMNMARAIPAGGDSLEQMRALAKAIFSGQTPLFGRLEVRDLKMAEALFPLSVRSFSVDWPSSDPLRCTSELDGLIVPTANVEQATGLSFPNLPAVEMSVRTSQEGHGTGAECTATYTVKDCFKLDLRYSVVFDKAAGRAVPWQYADMEEVSISGLDGKLEDRNLMAYVLWNVEGPEATGDGLIAVLPLLLGGEAGRAKTDSLSAFIKQPGTLSVNFTPESPLPAARLLEVFRDPSARLTISAEPGDVSVQDQIKKMLSGSRQSESLSQ